MAKRFTTFVMVISPMFWLKEVTGGQPKSPDKVLAKPSQAREPEISFSLTSRSRPVAQSAEAVSYTHLDVYKRQCIHNSARGSSLRTGTEQPVLPANCEWSDCILGEIIGQTAMAVFQIGHQGVFPILGIVHRLRQTSPFVWSDVYKRQNL